MSAAKLPVLTVRGLAGPSTSTHPRQGATHDSGTPSWTGLDLDVYQGDVVLLRGPSGVGKSTLLKIIANVQSNVEIGESNTEIRLYDKLPYEGRYATRQANCSTYRTQVLYVAQRPSIMEGTPEETLRLIRSFAAQQEQNVLSWPVSIVSSLLGRAADIGANRSSVVKRVRDTANSYGWSISDRNNPVPADGQPAPEFERSPANPKQVAEALGLKDYHWTQNWSTLSGGEAQRMSISIALSLALPDATSGQSRVCVFLLDEPTSALDTQSAQAVERLVLLSKAYRHIAIVWITHSDEQAARVGQLCAKMKGRRVRVLQLS